MYFFFACLIFGGAWYLRAYFLSEKIIPVLAAFNGSTASFASIVPTAGSEQLEIELDPDFEKEWEAYKPVLIEEADTILLLEAEKLIDQVEKAASSKTTVYEKLRSIVPGFMMLYDTAYYEPINKLIFQLVQTECGIALSDQQLAALWK
jgi:hypothetical protein